MAQNTSPDYLRTSGPSDRTESGLRGDLARTIAALFAYCRKSEWAGADPYDALNSPLFARAPLAASKTCRLIAIQALKRSPLNLRRLLIPPAQNPKALALFVSALVKLVRCGELHDRRVPGRLAERLAVLRSRDTQYWCWGYSFPWQTRRELVPRFSPNVVCTTFVGNALLDLYDVEREPRYLAMAVSAGNYITRELFWKDSTGAAGFSYPSPPAPTRVHNANLLAAAFLWRTHTHHSDVHFADAAFEATRSAVAAQRPDGSWPYGESPSQQWIDNFHTGYNLCALEAIGRYAGTSEYESHLLRGFEFYRRHFFNTDGSPRYFHDRAYPIDVHCVAQSIITGVTLRDKCPEGAGLADAAYDWAMDRMWNRDGYFYYRVHRLATNRISYMRWSQAWMCLALTTLLVDRRERDARLNQQRRIGVETQSAQMTAAS